VFRFRTGKKVEEAADLPGVRAAGILLVPGVWKLHEQHVQRLFIPSTSQQATTP